MKNYNINSSVPAPRLAEYDRWLEGERLQIIFDRVERALRNAFFNREWFLLDLFYQDRNNFYCFHLKNSGLSLDFHWLAPDGRPFVLDWLGEAIPFANVLDILSLHSAYDLTILSASELEDYRALRRMVLSPMTLLLIRHYSAFFNIPEKLNGCWIPEKQELQPVDAVLQSANQQPYPAIIFYGREQAPQFILQQVAANGQLLLLPVVFFQYRTFPGTVFPMYEIPYSGKVPFYNAELIVRNPLCTVILSDELAIPLINDSTAKCVFSSWYGGMEVASDLDFSLLEGHPVELLCFERHCEKNAQEKNIRINALAALVETREIPVKIRICDGVSWSEKTNAAYCFEGRYKNMRLVSLSAFRAENAIASHETDKVFIYSAAELKKLKSPEFVLYPVLMTGYYALIYGGTGVAKTWFALHLALSVSMGRSPFPNWKLYSGALEVLYIAGEMSPDVYGERLRILSNRNDENARFHFIRENFNLCRPVDQAKIVEIIEQTRSRMIVFDNLTTLAENGCLESNFSKIVAFFASLQKRGIIVLLVHHENRQGGFKGTSKITDLADQSIHLLSAGRSSKIEILVQGDKIRNVPKSDQQPFHAAFDPAGDGEWTVTSLTKEERARLDEDDPLDTVSENIGKKRNDHCLAWKFMKTDERAETVIDDVLCGCRNDVIAANLAIRESVIQTFREEYGITDEALASIVSGNKSEATTTELAKKIWKMLKAQNEAEFPNRQAQSERLCAHGEKTLEKPFEAAILSADGRKK